jgi:exopolysaccharide biosynthesis polyprenyl glycosylphosphotransferase
MKRADLFFTGSLLPLDFLALVGAASAAYSLRFSNIFSDLRPVIFDLTFPTYMNAVFPAAFILLFIFALAGLYSIRPRRIAVEMTRILLGVSSGFALLLTIAFFSRELFDSRFILIAAWVLAITFVAAERLLIRMLQRSLRRYGIGVQHIVLIGKTKPGHSIRTFFDAYPRFGYHVTAHFAHFDHGTKDSIKHLKKKDEADTIFIANPDITRKEVRAIKMFSDNEQLGFVYSAELFPGSTTRPIFHTFAGQPVIEVPKTPLDGWGAIYKRGFDIVVSLFLIILTLPIQIITALLIVIEDPGPFLHFQKRVGQRGKRFTYFKFRSMVKDAHTYRFDKDFLEKHRNMREGTPLFKLKHDPRVTRIGGVIRKFSIDELPEFYLVLFGKMSLIGPRPHMPKEVAEYKPSQRRVLTIKPGVSGLAQISGRADIDFNEEVTLDMHYIENWTPFMDLVILLKTPVAVLFRGGAY